MIKYLLRLICILTLVGCNAEVTTSDSEIIVEKGDKGDPGQRGDTGQKGDSGPKGEQGSPGVNGQDGATGAVGPQGLPGINGHSILSSSRTATALECSVSGAALDVYLDLDDSLTISSGDLLQSTLVACNGSAGPQGVQGPAGADGVNASAIVKKTPSVGFLTTTCVLVQGTTLYVRKRNTSSGNLDVDLYNTLGNCNSQSSSIVRLNAGNNETYWEGISVLLITDGTSNSNLLIRSLTFNP